MQTLAKEAIVINTIPLLGAGELRNGGFNGLMYVSEFGTCQVHGIG